MAAKFVHLHLHSEYSMLDGAIKLGKLCDRVNELNMNAVAVTDHGNMFAGISFYKKAKKAGIKPIIGSEFYISPGSCREKKTDDFNNHSYHLVLLAENDTGYRNLMELVSMANTEGYYYKPRIDKALLEKHSAGLIGLSACMKGEVPFQLLRGSEAKAKTLAEEYRDILGENNFFLELQENGIPEQVVLNNKLIALADELSIPLVATNDCHYLHKDDSKAHEILLCIQTGKTINDTNRLRFSTDHFYLKSIEEMYKAFGDHPEALENTVKIAERCNVDLDFKQFYLPDFPVSEDSSIEKEFRRLSIKGLDERLKRIPEDSHDSYRKRLEIEITTIMEMGYPGYFLIVWDMINYARQNDIPVGPGRGSAAGSLVAYALKITDIDPIEYGLIFERFLNPERVSLPDIDMDFCMDRRQEVIDYVNRKYGSEHVAQIITFGTMAAKGAIKDVGRASDIPYNEVDKISKLIPPVLNITIAEAVKQEPELKRLYKEDAQVKKLIDMSMRLEGLTRHASTHAAGVVISQDKMTNHTPLFKNPSTGDIVTQYAKDELEDVGLVKFDFLGLRTLTVIDNAVKMLKQKDIELDISAIAMDDPETYNLISTGGTTGIFQLESSGMQKILVQMSPERFEDIIAILALYRPGPLGSGMVEQYIKRKKGEIAVEYPHPDLEEILRETYGVMVYQEQVMKTANIIGGFSLGGADLLRRAMGKKKKEEMTRLSKLFVEGAGKRDIDAAKAQEIFDLMAFFAGYGFNKSHSAAYAMVTYQAAYLKTHHPVELMAAILTSEMGNSDKLIKYINECKEMDIIVMPPDINESSAYFTVIGESIRFGFAAIKNVGMSALESILDARNREGAFVSMPEFCRRINLNKVNKRNIEWLIKSGAFDSLGDKRSQLLAILDQAMLAGNRASKERASKQASLFSLSPEIMKASTEITLPDIPELDNTILLQDEKEALGFFVTGHPLDKYSNELKLLKLADAASLQEKKDGEVVKTCAIVTEIKKTVTKRGKPMAYLKVEDLTGSYEIILFPDIYEKVQGMEFGLHPVLFKGKLDKGERGCKLLAETVDLFEQRLHNAARTIQLKINSGHAGSISRLRELMTADAGCNVIIKVAGKDDLTINLPDRYQLSPASLDPVRTMVGAGNVTVLF